MQMLLRRQTSGAARGAGRNLARRFVTYLTELVRNLVRCITQVDSALNDPL